MVIHVAAIGHNKTLNDWEIYHRVNTLLPVEVAEVAKNAGVKQFIFLSTMGVYGVEKKLVPNVIDAETEPAPTSLYVKSKYEAEQLLRCLEDENFTVSVVTPPNVYGKGCKGGYITGFTSIVRKLPFIPCAYGNVKQSMIYIDNLCELIYQLSVSCKGGVLMPQDDRAVSAVELMNMLAKGLGISRAEVSAFAPLIHILAFLPIVNKAYGGVEYSKVLSEIDGINYRVVDINEGIRRTVS